MTGKACPRALRFLSFPLLLSMAVPLAAQEAAQVQPVDLSELSPADFRDDELYLPYYLQHFYRLANAVLMSGPERGFIDLSVWRPEDVNEPYNARIMENILSIAFFYATDRPWNPYHADPAVRARLEAALDFWVRAQSDDGRFSEYEPQRWGLAPTAFATKFMGETLQLLADGPPIDPDLHRQVIAAQRRAILAVFTDAEMYEHGRHFSNQFSNVWAGALGYLDLYPDPEVERKLAEMVERARPDHLSPAGFFYEKDGPDWGYNLTTHHSNLHMAWNYARGTEVGEGFEEETRAWYEWFSYNAVPESDLPGFTLNRAIESRQEKPRVTVSGQPHEVGFPLAEEVELARLLVPTRAQIAADRARQRTELEEGWPRVDSLPVGEFWAFSPYVFLHQSHAQWHPTEAQWQAAYARLPYLQRDRFTHQRVDARSPMVFTFVRRPTYYAAFNAGDVVTEQQRYGLGLLWAPGAGTFIQSQSAGVESAWGTRGADSTLVYEARDFPSTFHVGERAVAPVAGNRDLPDGVLRASYPLGSAGSKSVRFEEASVAVEVNHAAPFVEQIPLLIAGSDRVEQEPGRVEVRRGDTRFLIRFDPSVRAAIRSVGETDLTERQVRVVSLPGEGSLRYSLEVVEPER